METLGLDKLDLRSVKTNIAMMSKLKEHVHVHDETSMPKKIKLCTFGDSPKGMSNLNSSGTDVALASIT